jgi:hypothetical protein
MLGILMPCGELSAFVLSSDKMKLKFTFSIAIIARP